MNERHENAIRSLARAMHGLRARGSREFDGRMDNWSLARELSHDGTVDVDALWYARQALGEQRCSFVYEAEREQLTMLGELRAAYEALPETIGQQLVELHEATLTVMSCFELAAL
jgi:hypothetical protein